MHNGNVEWCNGWECGSAPHQPHCSHSTQLEEGMGGVGDEATRWRLVVDGRELSLSSASSSCVSSSRGREVRFLPRRREEEEEADAVVERLPTLLPLLTLPRGDVGARRLRGVEDGKLSLLLLLLL